MYEAVGFVSIYIFSVNVIFLLSSVLFSHLNSVLLCVCACVCVCVRARACVCVCASVRACQVGTRVRPCL